MTTTEKSIKSIAPINIAVVKYWGKENEEFNTPLNSSISVTLHVKDMCAETEVVADSKFKEDKLFLNGREEDIQKNKRVQRCLNMVRSKPTLKRKHNEDATPIVRCHITSANNFPTAAGLASSAAGYACLAKCLGHVYNYEKDLSVVARLGSGSACRSMLGGFVKWEKGKCPEGSDSCAVQIANEHHWPELKVIILVVSSNQKSVGSTEGMRRSVTTSQLLKYRAEHCVPGHIDKIEKAIHSKDFPMFAELTMKESNQLHAICQDTYPPLRYMNTTSHDIVNLITKYNAAKLKAAYTFDAGANAVLFTLDEFYEELLSTLLKYFPFTNTEIESWINMPSSQVKELKTKAAELPDVCIHEDALQRIICTMPGPGASVVVSDE
ncbi:diphosphomevalonate decarboxylase-like isoform X2 [Hydractinia symbiolongicarpus]|uniref:diphosphomevalonate decarboxylase-like isoform X2 n=1 Tax=Hydractinia symbiolongicarpus TaxID=13093 RepID=UPI00255001C2|nr:diphosphomevalonate decarboxylase-like isoform X2 [Hydractinia symbiolongicarpus]